MTAGDEQPLPGDDDVASRRVPHILLTREALGAATAQLVLAHRQHVPQPGDEVTVDHLAALADAYADALWLLLGGES